MHWILQFESRTMNIQITTNQDTFDIRPTVYVEKEDGLRTFNSYFNKSRLNNMLKWQFCSQTAIWNWDRRLPCPGRWAPWIEPTQRAFIACD